MNQETLSVRPRGELVRRVALVILCAIGMGLCALLLQSVTQVGSGILNKICAPSANVDCAGVMASAWSKIGGISAAMLGFVYFGALLTWFAGVGIPNRAARYWHLIPLLLSMMGLAFSVYFVLVMATQLNVWCTLCIGVHVVNALIWIVTLMSWPRAGGEIPYPSPVRAGIVLGSTGVAAVILALGTWSIQLQIAARGFQKQLLEAVNDPAYVEWKLSQQPVQQIAIGAADLVLGNNDAKNTVVVFSDFDCPNCRMFDQFAQRMVNLGMNVRIGFKEFPMSSNCNPFVKERFHVRACRAARAAASARTLCSDISELSKFRNLLFDRVELALTNHEIKLHICKGVAWGDVLKIIDSPQVSQKVEQDIELGHRLGVEGTPAIFVNGRRLKTNWQIVTNDVHPRLDLDATDALWRRLLNSPSPQK